MKKVGIIIVLLFILSLAGFIINGRTITPEPSDEKTPPNTVIIKGFAFTPNKITVKKGTAVTFENQDIARHNVVDENKDPNGPKGPLIGKGEKYEFTFTKTGTYKFYCEPHPFMRGVVEVVE